MNINKDNYEAFFLDYYDHSLNPAQVAELMLFLEQHPELKDEFESFEQINLVPDFGINYTEKENLKKNNIIAVAGINEKNYEEFFISSIEGILTSEESRKLSLFIDKNPLLEKELALLRLTMLKPETDIIFEDKESLKRKAFMIPGPAVFTVYRRWLYPAVSVAAMLVIFFSIYINLDKKHTDKGPAVAVKSEKSVDMVKQNKGQKNESAVETISKSPQLASKTEKNIVTAKTGIIRETKWKREPLVVYEKITSVPSVSSGLIPEGHLSANISMENRTYFTGIYSYIMLRESIDYFQYQYERENKPALARVISNFREKVLGVDMKDQIRERNTGLWFLAEAGIKSVNFITNSNFQLRRHTDEEGKTLSYAISSDRIGFSKTIKSYREGD